MAFAGSAANDPLAIKSWALLCSWLSMSLYSAAEITAYTATAIRMTTIATIDMASSITRQRSDNEVLVCSERRFWRRNSVFRGIREVFREARNPHLEQCGSVAARRRPRSCDAGNRHTPRAHYPTWGSRNPTPPRECGFASTPVADWRSASPAMRIRYGSG